ncbi:MAG: pyruvate kinase [Lentisphaerae bacterium]|nr:pyruvate kinase [Lentisphaerota bacterium]
MKRHIPRTKIVCTLGPASAGPTMLRKLVNAGMDIARINFSHGDHDSHRALVQVVRNVNGRTRRHVRLLADLEGPRIRVGTFQGGKSIPLVQNRTIYLVKGDRGDERHIAVDYEGDLTDFKGATRLYLDDGNLILEVVSISSSSVRTRVLVGGELKQRKSVNLPGARLHFPAISEKDCRDLAFAQELGFDYVAQSFVQRSADIDEVRRRLAPSGERTQVIAKIENRDGVRNIDPILAAADGVMVARGDMGVCLPIYEVPFLQKMIIAKANACGKMVITATQMLEHMVEHSRPTRAEASDIANAVLDGTDAVMLSAETAVGKYPAEAVRVMNDILKYAEEMQAAGCGISSQTMPHAHGRRASSGGRTRRT